MLLQNSLELGKVGQLINWIQSGLQVYDITSSYQVMVLYRLIPVLMWMSLVNVLKACGFTTLSYFKCFIDGSLNMTMLLSRMIIVHLSWNWWHMRTGIIIMRTIINIPNSSICGQLIMINLNAMTVIFWCCMSECY